MVEGDTTETDNLITDAANSALFRHQKKFPLDLLVSGDIRRHRSELPIIVTRRR
jgi:hypothetical protein